MYAILFLAAGLGFEPRYSAPKADVLPLDDPAMVYINEGFFSARRTKTGLPAGLGRVT